MELANDRIAGLTLITAAAVLWALSAWQNWRAR